MLQPALIIRKLRHEGCSPLLLLERTPVHLAAPRQAKGQQVQPPIPEWTKTCTYYLPICDTAHGPELAMDVKVTKKKFRGQLHEAGCKKLVLYFFLYPNSFFISNFKCKSWRNGLQEGGPPMHAYSTHTYYRAILMLPFCQQTSAAMPLVES